jgi:hypothetical protein
VRFSYFAVPVMYDPSTGNALTGSKSPSPDSRGTVTRFTKSGASSGTVIPDGPLQVTASGTSTSVSSCRERSMAAKFRSTMTGPRLP